MPGHYKHHLNCMRAWLKTTLVAISMRRLILLAVKYRPIETEVFYVALTLVDLTTLWLMQNDKHECNENYIVWLKKYTNTDCIKIRFVYICTPRIYLVINAGNPYPETQYIEPMLV